MSVDEGKEAAIRGLHAYREELLQHIAAMKKNVEVVERSIALLSESAEKPRGLTTPGVGSQSNSSVSSSTRYGRLKPQAAVELFLEETAGSWFKASEVVKELLRRGMPKTNKAFHSSIAGALNRAVQKGLAVREKRQGVLRYCLRRNAEPSQEKLENTASSER